MSDQALKITLVRSPIGYPERQRQTARSLGLTKMNRTVVLPDRPEIRGMARKIEHLVRVEEVPAGAQPATAKAVKEAAVVAIAEPEEAGVPRLADVAPEAPAGEVVAVAETEEAGGAEE